MALVSSIAAIELAFGDVLDVLVDSEDEVVAGFGLFFNAGKTSLARVDGDHQLAGLALQLPVELALEAAETLIVGADVSENLCGQLTLG